MKYITRLLTLFTVLLVLHGCDFGSGPTGSGTEGNGLTGILVDGHGTAIAGAKVRVYPGAASRLAKGAVALVAKVDSTTTGKNGSFRFANLPDGLYNLEASITRHDTLFSVFIPDIDFVKKLDLGKKALQVSGSLRVQIRDSVNAPIVGASCSISGTSWKATSSSSGECTLQGVAPGEYRVQVNVNGVATTTDAVTVVEGQTTSAGTLNVTSGGEGNFIPANWVRTSLRGYVYYVPPELILQWEGTGDDSWDAQYRSASITLQMGSGMVGPLDRPDSFPEYSEASWVMDTLTSGGFTYGALLIRYRIPESMSEYYGTGFIAGLQVYGSSPAMVIGSGPDMLFRAVCATRADQAIATRILRSVRVWKGPGPAPVPAPFKPTLLSPRIRDTVSASTSSVKVSWRAALGSTLTASYRVQVSLSPSFVALIQNDSVPFNRSIIGPDSLSQTLLVSSGSGLTYYWRVLAVGPGGMTASEIRNLYVPPSPPTAPLLTSPRDGYDSIEVYDARLSWQLGAGSGTVTSVRVEVGSDSSFSTPALFADTLMPTETQWKVPYKAVGIEGSGGFGLNYGQRYFWRVTAVGPGGIASSVPRSFSTLWPKPSQRTLVAPAVNDTGVSRTPLVSWEVIVDGATNESYFRVQISLDSLFQNLVINDSAQPFYSSAHYNWRVSDSLNPSTRYFVRVVAVGRGGSTPSVSRAFTTGTLSIGAPLIPQLASPAANGTVAQNASTFSWMSANRGSTTTSYYLQVASDSLFNYLSVYDTVEPGNAQTGLTTWTLKYSVLESGKAYFWRVIGTGPGGFTPSEVRKVIVQ